MVKISICQQPSQDNAITVSFLMWGSGNMLLYKYEARYLPNSPLGNSKVVDYILL